MTNSRSSRRRVFAPSVAQQLQIEEMKEGAEPNGELFF
jgi:hypothetical protein